ncbi:hypothetical protein, partial [Vibrio gazogenes]|uniref:hypothetical protein n=1 Tax=Vibrio gazogenes TaxID=687 RepID=UPI0019676C5C
MAPLNFSPKYHRPTLQKNSSTKAFNFIISSAKSVSSSSEKNKQDTHLKEWIRSAVEVVLG